MAQRRRGASVRTLRCSVRFRKGNCLRLPRNRFSQTTSSLPVPVAQRQHSTENKTRETKCPFDRGFQVDSRSNNIISAHKGYRISRTFGRTNFKSENYTTSVTHIYLWKINKYTNMLEISFPALEKSLAVTDFKTDEIHRA